MAEKMTGDVLAELRQLEADGNKNDDYAKLAILIALVGLLISIVLAILKVPGSGLIAMPICGTGGYMMGQSFGELNRIKVALDLIKARLTNASQNLKASAIVREAISAKREWKGCDE